MSDTPAEPTPRAPHQAPAASEPSPEIAPAEAPPPPKPLASPEMPASAGRQPSRRTGAPLPWLLAVALVVLVGVATVPFWAPAVMPLLPWGKPAPAAKPSSASSTTLAPPAPTPAPASPPAAPPDPRIAAARMQAVQNAAALQQFDQRLAALEAKPAPAPPDLSAIQQQLTALAKANGELAASVTAVQKAEQEKPATDPKTAALALVLLQIREAVELARPFDAEYQSLLLLARDYPEIAAAAQPLAGSAAGGVASRPALAERLRELGSRIATARAPPKSGWKSQIVARLRALVTIRRVAGEAQTPAEAGVSTAERAMASGDLAGAVEALSGLTGPAREAAEPWLQMARQRLAVEAALRQVEAAVTAVLGNSAPGKG
ncbi:MAG TPA: mitofilin family membrane protein [Stellaceae bacterium]|nr:mitofilin family membrane protein [Stellaceae bacterium]